MSEKLYALLLRLYPARFRHHYGEEAMRVFRERLRDERGPASRLRLWLEMLLDLGSSLPREYHRGGAPALTTGRPALPSGVPLFQSLETQLPRPGSFLGGAVMAFFAVAALGFLLNHAGKIRHFAQRYADMQTAPAATQSPVSLPSGAGPGGSGLPARAPVSQAPPDQLAAGQLQVQRAPAVQTGPGVQLDDAARRRILNAVEATLRASYPNPQTAQSITASLSFSESRGMFHQFSNPGIFAYVVTQQMRSVGGDSGLVLYFVDTSLPQIPSAGAIHWIDAHFLLRVPKAQPAAPPAPPSIQAL